MNIRRTLGRLVEWALGYERTVTINGGGQGAYGVPTRHHSGDAGYDLYVSKDTMAKSHSVTEIPTGVFIEPDADVWFEIRGRSSALRALGLQVQPAVIDNGYRGELFICVYNVTKHDLLIVAGQRIAQVIPNLLLPVRFQMGKFTKASTRGTRGFGSTGA